MAIVPAGGTPPGASMAHDSARSHPTSVPTRIRESYAGPRINTGTDVAINWTIARELSIGAGLGVVWSGGYLRESTDVRRHYAPYVVGTVSF